MLVEGQSDKRTLSRLLLERMAGKESVSALPFVDTAEIICDDAVQGMGNRDRVIRIAASASQHSSKFNWLVDREWSDYQVPPVPVQLPQPSLCGPFGYSTLGHSIENYSFTGAALEHFLKLYFGDQLPAQYFALLSARYANAIRMAACISLAAKNSQIVSRLSGFFEHTHLIWLNERFALTDAVNAKLASRGSAVDLAGLTNDLLNAPDVSACPSSTLRWIAHGHIGNEVVRACAGSIAAELGTNAGLAAEITTGRRTDKVLVDSHYLVTAPEADLYPINELLDWAG